MLDQSSDDWKATLHSTNHFIRLQSYTMSYVLLTGATGNLGAVILEQLLAAGQNVNAIVRSLSKSKGPLSKQYETAVKSGQLTFTEIPDMTIQHAFDEAAQKASGTIHAATPLSESNFLEKMIKPVSTITKSLLDAAAASKTVMRVIITGSIVATLKFPDDLMSGRTISEKDWNSVTLEEAVSARHLAYQYSKAKSEQEAWAYMETKKPRFELIYLLAPSITGKSIQPGAQVTKKALGGISSFYREIFDVEKPGKQTPFFM
jgi:NADPH-dependent methylglyoxal reductase